jgi:adenylate cyclase
MRRLWRLMEEHPAVAIIVMGHLVFAGAAGLHAASALERMDLLAYDQGLRWRAAAGARDPRITVIGIREQDLLRHGWPLSDGILADIITRLCRHDVRGVAIDIYRDHPVAPGSDRLEAALAAHAEVLWIYRFGGDGDPGTPAPAVMHETGRIGFADMPLDRDGIVRRGLLFLDRDEVFGVSLPLMMALHYLAPEGITLEADARDPALMRLGPVIYVPFEPNDGGYRGADARGYQVLLDYALGGAPFDIYSLSDLYAGRVPDAALADRLVFVGTMTETVKDLFHAPVAAGTTHDALYGVVLHALVTSQLLRNALDGAPLTASLGEGGELLWIWAWCLLGAMWGCFAAATIRFAIGLAAGGLLLGALWYGVLVHYLWLPLAPAAFGWAGAAALLLAHVGQREKTAHVKVMRLFSSHVSPAVAAEIWRNRDSLLENGRPRPQRLTATVLFSDIEGFTPISERLDAAAVTGWLDRYLAVMTGIIAAHDGVVLRFIGDAILAVFGVPVARTGEAGIDADAVNAVACALAMADALERLNRESEADGLPPVRVRIGINTGPMVAGSLGSAERMEYTVLGDSVNTAARLEVFAKQLPARTGVDVPCRIAVAEATWQRLDGRFAGVWVGREAFKGKTQTVGVYQVTGQTGPRTGDTS